MPRETNTRLKVLRGCGQGLPVVTKADIKRKIVKGPFTPLKQATIRRKGSDKPLIDKGILRNSIRYVVKGGEKEDVKT